MIGLSQEKSPPAWGSDGDAGWSEELKDRAKIPRYRPCPGYLVNSQEANVDFDMHKHLCCMDLYRIRITNGI